jgi:hypothetical protein
MRADIHDGPEHNALQPEAGYIDARPLNASSTKTSYNARPDHTWHRLSLTSDSDPSLPFGPQKEDRPDLIAARHSAVLAT